MNPKPIPIIIAAGLILGAGCVNRGAQKQAERTQKIVTDQTKLVEVKPAITRTLFETMPITGEVTTSEDVSVGPKMPGKIAAVYVTDGSSVSAGQTLALLDGSSQSIQVSQAQAQVNAARSQLSQAISNARLAPSRSAAAVAQAEASLRAAKVQLTKALNGAREEERKQADSGVAAAKSNMETARKERDRQANLCAEGASSQQRAEQAENAYQAAVAQYEQALQQQAMTRNWSRPEDISAAREAVRQAEEGVRSAKANQKLDVLLQDQVNAARANLQGAIASLNLARQNIADLRVTAPFSGRVQGKPAQPGTVVGAGSPIVRIIGTGGTYFEGEFPASNVQQLKIGASVSVEIDGLSKRTLIGTVDSISPSASKVGRLFTARIRFPISPDVKPGMYARGQITLKTIMGATVVPSVAIVRRGEKDVVFIVKGTKAKLVTVTKGLVTDGLTHVLGVLPGDRVVVRGQGDLDEGSDIKVESPA